LSFVFKILSDIIVCLKTVFVKLVTVLRVRSWQSLLWLRYISLNEADVVTI